MAVIDFVYLTLTTIRVIIGINLILVGRKSKQKALYYLALNSFLLGTGMIFSMELIFPDIFIFTLLSLGSYFPSVYFIYLAFFQDRKFPLKLILILTSTFMTLSLIFTAYYQYVHTIPLPYQISFIFFGLDLILVSGLIVYSLNGAYAVIKPREYVEPWIKSRYKLVIINKIAYLATGFSFFLSGVLMADPEMSVFTYVIVLCQLIAITTDFLAWIMPKWFMKYLNRNYVETPEKEMTEEEIMADLKKGGKE